MDGVTHVQKRDGRTIPFDSNRIKTAVERAYRSEVGIEEPTPLPIKLELRIDKVRETVQAELETLTSPISVEFIQDKVEEAIASVGDFDVARKYILYRESRARTRVDDNVYLKHANGTIVPISYVGICNRIAQSGAGDVDIIAREVTASLRYGSAIEDLDRAITFALRSRIEFDPQYAHYAARSLLRSTFIKVTGNNIAPEDVVPTYQRVFIDGITYGVQQGIYDPRLLNFDLQRLASALLPERDNLFKYLGMQTVVDRYLLRDRQGKIFELPQTFWMRVAMGLAVLEDNINGRAIEFYQLLSSMDAISSTPTLFNAGTTFPQLSSCYGTTTQDDLGDIFKTFADHAQLSKWSGGIGADWTNVRSLGAEIRQTNGKSQGVIPFLKLQNDTAVAVDQSGKRKGAIAAYLEPWHADFEEFLDLRKNTGDERRRTHDLNLAAWIPDLFMKRVYESGTWWLFNPSDVPDLHESYGQDFEQKYTMYESLAESGVFPLARKVEAVTLWREMLGSLFETGYPWITFKDAMNVRNPQKHVGVIHNSNLCTEIALNNSGDEHFVCNLLSVNLANHVGTEGDYLNAEKLEQTVRTAMRMLDNVIDINYYPTKEAEKSNKEHRPVGLGMMGFQDFLWKQDISYASKDAVTAADYTMEVLSYYAIKSSNELAKERGRYPSYNGSLWDQDIFPIDSLSLLENERGRDIAVDTNARLNWTELRTAVEWNGMRNSNTLAIAPTATISNIAGVTQSIEPMFSNIFVKSNLSGEFTLVNEYLVADLKKLGLWDKDMLEHIKFYDGSIAKIERIPEYIRQKYPTAFEIEYQWLIECAAHRQKWIDQAQSLNLYIVAPSGRQLDEMYKMAWDYGLKTTYYLRSRAASAGEKASVDENKFGILNKWKVVENVPVEVTQLQQQFSSNMTTDYDEFYCESCQ